MLMITLDDIADMIGIIAGIILAIVVCFYGRWGDDADRKDR